MSKKIFAIGGGKDYTIYREMIKLSNIKEPQILVIPHAQPLEKQQGNYDRMYNIFVPGFGCKIKILKSNELTDKNRTKEMLDSSDIIYVCEGNTIEMINTWKKYGFDEMLKKEWEKGKLMAGTSSGANCWFNSFTTELYGNLELGEGINLVDAHLTCHGQKKELYDFHKKNLKLNSKLGILLTNGSAIEIVDDKCKMITKNNDSLLSFDTYEAYSIVSYYDGNDYNESKVSENSEFEEFDKSLVLKLKK